MGPPTVRYPAPVVRVRFLGRPNRYLARVRPEEGGRSFEAHVPNPGRMEELLVPGETTAYAVRAENPDRRTRFDLIAVRHGRTTVSIDSRIGNRVVAAALAENALLELGPGPWRREVAWGGSRFDFARTGAAGWPPETLLEVKCSNLLVGRTALFPDAPTERGARHLETLRRAAQVGIRALVVFVVQRSDARRFAPNAALDPAFARALGRARDAGVELRANALRVSPGRVRWGEPLPVSLRRDDQRLL